MTNYMCAYVYTYVICISRKQPDTWSYTPRQKFYYIFSCFLVSRTSFTFAFRSSVHYENAASRAEEMCPCSLERTFMGCLPDAHTRHDQFDLLRTSWWEQKWCRECKMNGCFSPCKPNWQFETLFDSDL